MRSRCCVPCLTEGDSVRSTNAFTPSLSTRLNQKLYCCWMGSEGSASEGQPKMDSTRSRSRRTLMFIESLFPKDNLEFLQAATDSPEDEHSPLPKPYVGFLAFV